MNTTQTTSLIRAFDSDPLDRRVTAVRRNDVCAVRQGDISSRVVAVRHSDVSCRIFAVRRHDVSSRVAFRVARPTTRPTMVRRQIVSDDDFVRVHALRIGF